MNTNQITPSLSTTFTPGAILVEHWGYEQTNVDFYCIIKVSGEWLTIMPLKKISSPESSYMSKKNTPGEINYNEKSFRKKLKVYNGVPSGFCMSRGGGWCRLWDGKPEISTHYA